MATATKTIRVSINPDVERLLEAMKEDYPALNYAEILKLGLSELYRKRELETRQAWIDSLPTMELTEEQQIELQKAIDEADKERAAGAMKAMNLKDFKAYLKQAVAESVD